MTDVKNPAENSDPPKVNLDDDAKKLLAGASNPTPGVAVPVQATQAAAAVAMPPVRRGRGRPRGSGKGRSASPRVDNSGDAPQTVEIGQSAAQVAAMVNGIWAGIASILAGDEGAPTPQEADAMNLALSSYLDAHPEIQVRPELLLAAAYLPYLARLVTRPTAKEKLAWGVSRVWTGIVSIFRRKKKEEPKNEAVS